VASSVSSRGRARAGPTVRYGSLIERRFVSELVDPARVPHSSSFSVQLVGLVRAEDVRFALAGQLEAARPWVQHRPRLDAIIRP
jgi:hypothetical protein